MKNGVVFLVVVAMATAGCAGESSGTDAAEGAATEGTTSTSAAPEVGSPDPNSPPSIDSFTASNESGEAPLQVSFTFDASDADGDSLSWALDVDGDGTPETEGGSAVLPFTFNWTYASAGTYNATFNVTDGEKAVEETLQVVVTEPEEEDEGPGAGGEGEGGGDNVTGFQPFQAELDIVDGCWLCIDGDNPATGEPGALGCIGYLAGQNEVDCAWLEVPAEAAGQVYSVYSVLHDSPFGTVDGDPDVEFWDSCGPTGSAIELHRTGSAPEEGIVPEGAGCMVLMEFFWPHGGATFHAAVGFSEL